MRKPIGLLALAVVVVAAWLAPHTASAEQAQYESQCVLAKAQQAALECPSGTAIAGKGGGRDPRSRMKASAQQQQAPAAKQPTGPGVSDAVVAQARAGFREKREQKARDYLMREIELLKQLINRTKQGDAELPPRRLRLAQNYEDLLQEARSGVRALDEPIYEARRANNKALVTKLAREQAGRETEVTRWREEAIKQYASLAKSHPDYGHRDEVLFRLAFMIEEQAADDRLVNERDSRPVPSGNETALRQKARTVYHALIKEYPRSRYIPNAYLSFAEYYFQEGDMQSALQFYERVAADESSDVFGYAVYKEAWCYINLQDDRRAVDQFVRVIDFAESHQDNRISGPLARQARRELIPPFSRVFPPSRAWEFFQRVGGDMALEMMEALAEHYYNQGQWPEAIAAYHSLMAQNPNSHRLCFYQVQVAECSRRAMQKPDQVVELRRTFDLLNAFASESHPAEAVTECRTAVAQMALEMATNWHQEAVGSDTSPGTNDETTMQLSSDLYRLAIEAFPDLDELRLEGWDDATRPTRYRVAYWAAELLWKRNQWSECGPAFDAVVNLDPQGEYLRDAAYAAVLCYNNLYQQQHSEDTSRRAEVSTPGKRGKKRLSEEEEAAAERERLARHELSATEEGMLEAYGRYICYVPDSDDLVRIKYRRARIHYEANHWEEAAVLFRDIAYNHSEDEVAPYAANLYLDCLNAISMLDQDRRVTCRDEMAVAVEHFITDRNLMRDEEFANQVTQLQCGILWKRAEARQEAGDFLAAADLYVRIYREYRDQCQVIGEGHGVDEVLYNAAINYEADYRIGAAIQIRMRLIQDFGDESEYAKAHRGASEWAKRAIYQIGGNYHAIAAYTKAADYYEDFARRFPGEKEGPDALRNATVFRLGLGDDEKAISNAQLFERSYGPRKQYASETATVISSIGTIYMRRQDWANAEKHYRSFLKRYGSSAGGDETVQAYTNIGYSLWQRGEKGRDSAVTEFSKAVAIADSGRPENEPVAARIERYKRTLNVVGESEEARAVDAVARLRRMVDSVAKARFYLGERSLERFTAIEFPAFRAESQLPREISAWHTKELGREKAQEWQQMLRFLEAQDRRNEISKIQFAYWVKNRFQPWMEKKRDAMGQATTLYLAVVDEDVPEWEIAASSRIGDMFRSFMQSLYDAPIDPSIASDEELVDIYRDALDQEAAPYRDSAIKAFDNCLKVATENRWFNEWSRSCERELNKLEPRLYPLSDEMRTSANYNKTPLAVPSHIKRLETREEREAREARDAAGSQE